VHERVGAWLLALAGFTACGCAGGVWAAGESGAKSPQAAATKFIDSLKSRDRKAYDAVVVPGGLANGVVEIVVAAESFKKKMIKAYGEEGWRNFQDSEGASITLAFQDLNPAEMKFTTQKDSAKGRLPEGEEVLRLIAKQGRWYIDLDSSFDATSKQGGLTAKSLAKAFAGMVKTIRRYEPKIGDGLTVDSSTKKWAQNSCPRSSRPAPNQRSLSARSRPPHKCSGD
jgi:hypothetical protein